MAITKLDANTVSVSTVKEEKISKEYITNRLNEINARIAELTDEKKTLEGYLDTMGAK
jgi:predicted transcriptional regulator